MNCYLNISLPFLRNVILCDYHIFAYTPWLSDAGEFIDRNFCPFLFITRDEVFELIETTHIDLVVISQTKFDRS